MHKWGTKTSGRLPWEARSGRRIEEHVRNK
jgi:hypothetical protein